MEASSTPTIRRLKPSRRHQLSAIALGASRVACAFLVYMLPPLPRRSGWAYSCSLTQPYQPSPKWQSGRPAHCPFRGLLGVHSRYGLHTRAVTVYRDTLSEGFSHFVTSMTAPVASGWSGCRVGLAPTGKRRLVTAHARSGPGVSLPEHPSLLTRRRCRAGQQPRLLGSGQKNRQARLQLEHERITPRIPARMPRVPPR